MERIIINILKSDRNQMLLLSCHHWLENTDGISLNIGSLVDCSICDKVRTELAENLRAFILQELQQAYENAGMSGLCAEGQWEVAIGQVKNINLTEMLTQLEQSARSSKTLKK